MVTTGRSSSSSFSRGLQDQNREADPAFCVVVLMVALEVPGFPDVEEGVWVELPVLPVDVDDGSGFPV